MDLCFRRDRAPGFPPPPLPVSGPKSPKLDDETAWKLLDYAELDAVRIDRRTGSADCGGGRLDYGLALDVIRFQWGEEPRLATFPRKRRSTQWHPLTPRWSVG